MDINVNAIIQICTTLISVGLATLAGVWKLSELKASLVKMINMIGTQVAVLSEKFDTQDKAIMEIKAEQKIIKKELEEMKESRTLIKANQQAMWDILHSLAPDKVTKRGKNA